SHSSALSSSRPPALPSLHSFPTRRSSDLRLRAHRPQPFPHGEAPRPDPPERSRHRPVVIRPLTHRLRSSDPRTARATHERSRAADRKSTRLNSSHVKISYAVFCLKKKKSI